MRTITLLIETVWGVSLPVDQFRPMLSVYFQAIAELLARYGR